MQYYQRLYGEGFVHMSDMAIRRMKGGGSIVGISSPGCPTLYNPNRGYDLQGSGKCVMEYACRLIALRCAPSDINCNVVVPGVTRTPAWDKLGKLARDDTLIRKVASTVSPSGSVLDPQQVGEVVSFLCSEEGRVVTGMVIPADGGVHLKI
jgi:NAD(P)-dependent dehydrogenase (short-subunit alcohol dehydrogenase family)